jgi:hypothetical protein
MDPKSYLNEAISRVDRAIHHPNDTVEKIHQGLATPYSTLKKTLRIIPWPEKSTLSSLQNDNHIVIFSSD